MTSLSSLSYNCRSGGGGEGGGGEGGGGEGGVGDGVDIACAWRTIIITSIFNVQILSYLSLQCLDHLLPGHPIQGAPQGPGYRHPASL